MGLLGGLCYVYMIVATLRYTFQFLESGNKMLSLGLIGVFFSMGGVWIGLGQYALAPFVCFCIGFVTREHLSAEMEKIGFLKQQQPAATKMILGRGNGELLLPSEGDTATV